MIGFPFCPTLHYAAWKTRIDEHRQSLDTCCLFDFLPKRAVADQTNRGSRDLKCKPTQQLDTSGLDHELRRGRLEGTEDRRNDQLRSNRTSHIVGFLKNCAKQKDLGKGSELHAYVHEHKFLEKDCFISSSLIYMYARCGAVTKAQEVLDELVVSRGDVITWNALIAGYVQQGQAEEALKCFSIMQQEGHSPNAVTFICALKACGSIGAAVKGEEIHANIVSLGLLEKDIKLGNALVNMYARCGALAKAQCVLNELPCQNAVSVTALIAGYVKKGQGMEALECFDRMQCEGHSPDRITFTHALRACASIRSAEKGEQIHDNILSLGLLENDAVLGSALVDMYVKCGAHAKAKQVLEELPIQDAIMWNALVQGYAQQGHSEEVLRCFDNMQCEGHSPNVVTFICALKACGTMRAIAKGEQIHNLLSTLGMLKKAIVLGNALVDMYVRCSTIRKVQEVFDELPAWDVVTWNSLITGYVWHGKGEEALRHFDSMQCRGYFPNAVTFTCALKACGSIGLTARGQQLHDEIVSLGLLEDVVVGNTLVDMYAKCGLLAKMQLVFDELPIRDVVTWNAIIAGYTQQGQCEDTLNCFSGMQCEGHSPNSVTYICVLKACGCIGAGTMGKEIHDKIASLSRLEKDIVLGGALVDMYANCGALEKAQKVFNELPIQNLVLWTALIGGYAQQGQVGKTLIFFEQMQSKEVWPDSTNVVCILNACSHSGLLNEAEAFIPRMNTKYAIPPDAEHFCCMVDLFGRAGKVDKALSTIEKMTYVDHVPAWLALLGACCKWGDVKIGGFAFEHAVCLDKSCDAAYIGMANIYSS